MEIDEEPEATNPKQVVTIAQSQNLNKSSGPVTIVTPANLIVSSIAGLGNQPKIVQTQSGGGVQRLQVVRLVSPTTGVQRQQTIQVTGRSSSDGTIRLVTANALSGGAKIQIPKSGTGIIGQQRTITTQRLILPATSLSSSPQIVTIPVSQNTSRLQTALSSGTTVITRPNTTQQVLAILSPQKTLATAQQPITAKVIAHPAQQSFSTSQFNLESSATGANVTLNTLDSVSIKKEATSAAVDDSKQRKPCNCTKSHCLKLYCDCFANGEFCSNCNCNSCQNNLENEEQRQKAIKQCLIRNPQAFHPKIGKGESAEVRRHQKGCNCKRSGCLKNYCECFEAKIACGSMCKCVGCKNCEDNSMNKSLMSLADAAMVRTMQQSAASDRLAAPLHSLNTVSDSSKTRESIRSHMKTAVIESVLDCLLAQCREAETAKCKPDTTEKVIIEEFGRCLSKIIHSSMTANAASNS